MQAPVRVTHHGRPRAMLISIDQYEKMGDGGVVAANAELPARELAGALRSLLHGMTEGFIALDDQLRMVAVNPVIEAFLGETEADLLGRHVSSLEDGERAAVFTDRYRWVQRTGEPASFLAKTMLQDREQTLSVRAFPYRGGVGVIYVNVTRQELMKDALAASEAESKALEAHPNVGAATLNALGFFVGVNPGFEGLAGFGLNQLVDLRLVDLVRASDRLALSQGMNALLQFRSELYVGEVQLMARDGLVQTVTISMARKMRDQVCAGFAVVITPKG